MANKNSKRNRTLKSSVRPRKRTSSKKKNGSRYIDKKTEIYAILIIMASILLIISVFGSQDSGYANQKVNDFLSYIFGIGKYIVPFFLILWGASFFLKQIRLLPSRFGWGFFLLFFSLLGIFSNNLRYGDIFDNILIRTRGGIVGAIIFNGLFKLFDRAGAITILSVLIIISILIITRISLISIGKKIREFFVNVDFRIFAEIFKRGRPPVVKDNSVPIRGRDGEYPVGGRKKLSEKNLLGKTGAKFVSEPEVIDNLRKSDRENQRKRKNIPIPGDRQLKMPIMEESGEDHNYQTPPINLLKKSRSAPAKLYKQSIKDRVSTLNKLFNDFNLPARIDRVVRGPSVTMYELTLSPGVKVQRLFSLEDDFCVALGSADLRILAPIPGKSAIGLEVPNKIRSIVTLGDIYSLQDKKLDNELLSVPLGKSLSGDIVYMNIVEMPHVLIAGATNSGKSSCLNSIVISLLMKAKPGELKFIMIDPKMVELSIYNGIPHLLSPVVVNPKKAAAALYWAVEEMENRFRVLVEKTSNHL